MALAQDPITALITYLQADSTISSLISTRVFGMELPKAEAVSMPRQCIVINGAGGIGDASLVTTFRVRIDFFCYGETPFEAWKVYRTLHTVLEQMVREVSSSTMLYSALHSAGPFPARDQKTDWPVVVDTWLIEFNTTECS